MMIPFQKRFFLVDRQTKESSHPQGSHRVKPGKELVTTDRPDSIAPVTPPRPRAADNRDSNNGYSSHLEFAN